MAIPGIRLHPQADRDAGPGDPPGLPLRCGTCIFRAQLHYRDGKYSKCWHPIIPADATRIGDSPRITHAPGTDVRAWWPACTDYQPNPKEGTP